MICVKCAQDKPAHDQHPDQCVDCVKAEQNRYSMIRNSNQNWMEIAADAGLELWERQPQETDNEWKVWLQYRDSYPGRKPTIRSVADDLDVTYNAVKKVSNRWEFPARMQAWVKRVDELTRVQREQEILDMNKQHVDMAQRLNEKISKAIDNIDPYELSPREVNSLIKTATELEAKGRMNQAVPNTMFVDESAQDTEKETKASDITEILKILGMAGVLPSSGVRQTVTTEVIVKGDDQDA